MKKSLADQIGSSARTARAALGLTQEDAADRIGVSTEFFARIERGRTMPSVPTLLKIARTLSVRSDVLLGLGGDEAPTTFREGTAPYQTGEITAESPELRRLVRRLRSVPQKSLKLLGQVAVAFGAKARTSSTWAKRGSRIRPLRTR